MEKDYLTYNFGSNINNQLFESITSENLESTLQNLSTSIGK